MKYKTAELEGELLDAAVAKALGDTPYLGPGKIVGQGETKSWRDAIGWEVAEFSTDWEKGGPILERLIASGFDIYPVGPNFRCGNSDSEMKPYSGDWSQEYITTGGPTILIAAMRAYVTSVYGEEVEIP